jgi:hypothetical protein
MNRFQILSDRSVFGVTLYKYGNTKFPCLLVIKNINNLTIEDRLKEFGIVDEIDILIGIGIDKKKKQIFISSDAEDKGKEAYTLIANYSTFDLELKDLAE